MHRPTDLFFTKIDSSGILCEIHICNHRQKRKWYYVDTDFFLKKKENSMTSKSCLTVAATKPGPVSENPARSRFASPCKFVSNETRSTGEKFQFQQRFVSSWYKNPPAINNREKEEFVSDTSGTSLIQYKSLSLPTPLLKRWSRAGSHGLSE